MRILAACSLGGSGHLNPLVPFLEAARRQGHETLVIGPPALQPLVDRAGFAFAPGGEPREAEVAPIRERLPVAPPREASMLGNRELFGRLAAGAMLPAMTQLCAEWAPGLIFRDPCEYASAVVAPTVGIPTAQVAISLASAEAGSIAVAAPALEEHRAGVADELLASPYLTRFPASLDPSPFATTIRFREPEVTPQALPDWWAGSTAPLVYLTFGTVVGYLSGAASIYRTAIDAVAGLDVRVLLTVGRRFDPSPLGQLPANVHLEAWVDHVDAVHAADLVVCHGGSGTVYGTLAAGVPLIVVPVLGDQFDNGRRVAQCGAGLTLARDDEGTGRRRVVDHRDAERITEAITEVLGKNSFRVGAERVAAEMAAAPTVDDVLATVVDGVGPRPT